MLYSSHRWRWTHEQLVSLTIGPSSVACLFAGVQDKPCHGQGGCFITSGSRSLSSWMNNRRILCISKAALAASVTPLLLSIFWFAVEILLFVFSTDVFSLFLPTTLGSGGRDSTFLLYQLTCPLHRPVPLVSFLKPTLSSLLFPSTNV